MEHPTLPQAVAAYLAAKDAFTDRPPGLPSAEFHALLAKAAKALDTMRTALMLSEAMPTAWQSIEDKGLPQIPPESWGSAKALCFCPEANQTGAVIYMELKLSRGKPTWFWNNRISPWAVTHWRALPNPPVLDKKIHPPTLGLG